MEPTNQLKEEKAIVLDFLPNGYPADTRPMYRKNPIDQAIGLQNFILLELVPKKGIFLQPYEEVYIGEGKREKIHHIIGRLPFEKLTATARAEIEFVVKDLVKKNESKFDFIYSNMSPLWVTINAELPLLSIYF